MMYALALNESGLGLSQYALEYHNLFGHAKQSMKIQIMRINIVHWPNV